MADGAGRLSQAGVNRLDRTQPSRLTRAEVTQRRLNVRRKLLERLVVEPPQPTFQMRRGQHKRSRILAAARDVVPRAAMSADPQDGIHSLNLPPGFR
jgi:hypothetical protein